MACEQAEVARPATPLASTGLVIRAVSPCSDCTRHHMRAHAQKIIAAVHRALLLQAIHLHLPFWPEHVRPLVEAMDAIRQQCTSDLCYQAHLVASGTQLLKGQHTCYVGLVIEEGVCMQSDMDQPPTSTTTIL